MTAEQETSDVPNQEAVHLVIDYWDGPREGVADYRGEPYYFKALFDEKRDEWSDVFTLSPLDSDTYDLLAERNHIWQRWHSQAAFSEACHVGLAQ